MIYFVGAGPGAEDLITVRGQRLLRGADVVIYAGSLVNPELLKETKKCCKIYNSAHMTLEEVLEVMERAEGEGLDTVRLHTGDPSLYGAVREQMDQLDQKGISYESCPGVSSFCGAAAALNLEYTLPDLSQSVVITRMEGRTPVPEREKVSAFAAHQTTMVLFLSAGLLENLEKELLAGGYEADTPAAIVYKATWPEEACYLCTVGTLAETAKTYGITKTALIIVGQVVTHQNYQRSKLYDPEFTTGYRKGKQDEDCSH
ncbi:precorrin-4 C(11)-methyltransferase [Lachnospiraceae bacterium KGMB03038]|nr:precorrin-4 C(11)-methyltransferase [Lachnospiraceae bacterium KGMB03038]